MRRNIVWLGVLLCVLLCGLLTGGQAARAQARPPAKTKTPHAAASKLARAQAASANENNGAAAPAELPVRNVVLYKGGVGYFEHMGRISGNEAVHIDFSSDQLNDVLGSLTVLDLNGGRITGIDYNSEAPFSRRLGMLGLPLGENTSLSKFLEALRGTRLEIRGGNSVITGRLLSVEPKTQVNDRTATEVDLATLVSDSGDVHTVEVTPAVQVRLADAETRGDVGQYLSLLASQHQQGLRRMTIATAGTGERELYVSYVSETPIWKTTYRIVLPTKPGDEPLLQGWAIVDNTTGEDWNNVELSLVAGAPQSFIQQLSQPYYARRSVVPLPQSVELTPQTHESAMTSGTGSLTGTVTDPAGAVVPGTSVRILDSNGQVVDTDTTDDRGKYELDGLSPGNYRVEFTKPGFQQLVENVTVGGGTQTLNAMLQVGSVAESVTVEAQAATDKVMATRNGVVGGIIGGAPPPAPMPALMDVMKNMAAAAKGASLGDLFEYKLKDQVTIHKNESALVPILQTHVQAEKVSLWNSSLGSERPLRALWLTNSSALTLDGGSFTVLEDNAFAGEGLTDPIKPNEKRLISYAADLGVRVNESVESQPQKVTHVRIARGVMFQTRELRQSTTYTLRDDDTTPRVVLIEHPLRAGWTLAKNAPQPAEKTSSVYRFRVELKPKQTKTLDVSEAEPQENIYQLSNLTDDQIEFFARDRDINPKIEAALRQIIEQKNVVAELAAQIASLNNRRQRIFTDQQRIRENLKALKGTAEERALIERYTQQLENQEDQLQNLQKQNAELQPKHDQARAELDKMIQELTLDETI
ncbi:MAG TPA: carboxypeptidase regulatory-like domain-containing protein [Candidatus Acidoferrales bacterium]|nr:carboxypeptidase regulatory-like domain-containing protein [Candidatus Acidoferrales bacterium]